MGVFIGHKIGTLSSGWKTIIGVWVDLVAIVLYGTIVLFDPFVWVPEHTTTIILSTVFLVVRLAIILIRWAYEEVGIQQSDLASALFGWMWLSSLAEVCMYVGILVFRRANLLGSDIPAYIVIIILSIAAILDFGFQTKEMVETIGYLKKAIPVIAQAPKQLNPTREEKLRLIEDAPY